MKNENGDGIFVTPSGEETSIPQPDQTLNLAEGDSLDRSEGEPPIGEEIPEDLYRGVAEVLAMVYKLKAPSN